MNLEQEIAIQFLKKRIPGPRFEGQNPVHNVAPKLVRPLEPFLTLVQGARGRPKNKGHHTDQILDLGNQRFNQQIERLLLWIPGITGRLW